MITDLFAGFCDLLPASMTVYRSRQEIPQNASAPYLLVEVGPGSQRDRPDRLQGFQTRTRLILQVRFTAATAAYQRDASDEVQAAVVNHRPAVPGYVCWPIRLINARSLDDGQKTPTPTGGSYPLTEWLEEYELRAEPTPA